MPTSKEYMFRYVDDDKTLMNDPEQLVLSPLRLAILKTVSYSYNKINYKIWSFQ